MFEAAKHRVGDLKWSVRQRIQYIEIAAYFTGLITNKELGIVFGVSQAAATKDLSQYKELAPNNLEYDGSVKGYRPSKRFSPIVADFSAQNVLATIAGASACQRLDVEEMPPYGIETGAVNFPARFPSMKALASILRAIRQHKKLTVQYSSLSSDELVKRIIEPHAIANDGIRWHVRAWDEEKSRFSDFVLSRISNAEHSDIESESDPEEDHAWHKVINLVLMPHPNLEDNQRKAMELDFAMYKGEIKLPVRASLAGYTLIRMNIDATNGYEKDPTLHQLALKNKDELVKYAGWAMK